MISDPTIARFILQENAKAYDKGILAEILAPIMGKGLIPADPETWKVRRRAIVPGFHKKWYSAMVKTFVNWLVHNIYTIHTIHTMHTIHIIHTIHAIPHLPPPPPSRLYTHYSNQPLLSKLENAAATGEVINMETEFCSVALGNTNTYIYIYTYIHKYYTYTHIYTYTYIHIYIYT